MSGVRVVGGRRHAAVTPVRRGRLNVRRTALARCKAARTTEAELKPLPRVAAVTAAAVVAFTLQLEPASAADGWVEQVPNIGVSVNRRLSPAARARILEEAEVDEAPPVEGAAPSSKVSIPELPSLNDILDEGSEQMEALLGLKEPAGKVSPPVAAPTVASSGRQPEAAPPQLFEWLQGNKAAEPDVVATGKAGTETSTPEPQAQPEGNGLGGLFNRFKPQEAGREATGSEAAAPESSPAPSSGLVAPAAPRQSEQAAPATDAFAGVELPDLQSLTAPTQSARRAQERVDGGQDSSAGGSAVDVDSSTAVAGGLAVVTVGGLAFALYSNTQRLEKEQQAAEALRQQIADRDAAIAAEQRLVAQLRGEMEREMEASTKAAGILKAQGEKLASEKAQALAAVGAQERLNASLRAELAATEDRLRAESAAKAIVEQEKQRTQASLDETSGKLRTEEGKSTMLEGRLAETQAELIKEQKAGTAMGEQIVDLSGQLEREKKRAVAAEARGDSLDSDLKRTAKELEDTAKAFAARCKDAEELSAALAALKAESAKLQDKAKAQQEAATRDRKAAADAYATISEQLAATQAEAQQLGRDFAKAKAMLDESRNRVMTLSGELQSSQEDCARLSVKVAETQTQLSDTTDALSSQREESAALRQEVSALNTQMMRLADSLAETTDRLSQESDTSQEMKTQLAELKKEYIAAGDRLESDQTTIRKLETDLRTLESQLSTAVFDKKAAVMENAQLASLLDGSRREVAELRSITEQEIAKRESADVEIENLVTNLERVQGELMTALQLNADTQQELEKSVVVQQQQAEELGKMQQELDEVRAAEVRARSQAMDEMRSFKEQVEAARALKSSKAKKATAAAGAASGTIKAAKAATKDVVPANAGPGVPVTVSSSGARRQAPSQPPPDSAAQ